MIFYRDSATGLDGGLIACEPGEYSAFFTVGMNRDPEQLNYLALFCGSSFGTDLDLIVRRNLLNIRSIYEAIGNAYTRSQLVSQGEILAHNEEFAGQIFSPVALRCLVYAPARLTSWSAIIRFSDLKRSVAAGRDRNRGRDLLIDFKTVAILSCRSAVT